MAIVVKPRDIWGALGSGLGSGFSQGVLRMMMDKLDQEKEKRRFNEQAFTSGYTPVDVPSETMHGAEFPGQPPEGAVKGPHGGYWTPPKEKPSIKSVDLGNEVQVYRNGELTATYPKGSIEKSKEWGKPKKAGKDNEYGLPEGAVYQMSPEGQLKVTHLPKEKVEERPYEKGEQVTTTIGDETTVQIVAGYDKKGIPFDTEGKPIKTGIGTKVPSATITPEERKLKDLSSRFDQALGRAQSAQRGVGQYLKDPNKEQVAKQGYNQALRIAIEYGKKGGNPQELGVSPESIKGMLSAGLIDRTLARKALKELFSSYFERQ